MPYFLDSVNSIDDKPPCTHQFNDNLWGIEWEWNFANEQKYFNLHPSSRNINMCLCYFFLNFIIYLFIYLWLRWVFIAERGLSLVAASRLLFAVASLVAEHGL